MTLAFIDIAIENHIKWVVAFNTALTDASPHEFDLPKARDDSACALGGWLNSTDSYDILGQDFHHRAVALHSTFHEIAGEVIVSLNANDPHDVTEGLVAALGDLSKSLIEFLEFARKQLGGEPRNWNI